MTSSIETLVLAFAAHALGIEHAPIIAAVIVSAFYYGREAGQRDHDLAHDLLPVKVFFGAEFALRWTRGNWAQWLAAAAATSVVAVGLMVAGL